MSFTSGHQLAHYQIVEPIGKGGMGEVYRARDGKLGRDVAIKVLPDEFAANDERLRRFQREAKVLASLNHPNIAAIYGLEQSGSTHYLVLELLPGETLAERLARGPIPVAEAIEIAMKIAEALEEAHEQGIVHRDLKPANIMLTPDGKVKVLDFGLAKAFVEDAPDADSSMSPTLTRDATRVGVILGTAAYMSPEQAKGKPVDKRADVWAFGVVLYEMLTGKRAFAGEDVSDTLAFVLTKEPEWEALPAETPPVLRQALRVCLTKDPKRRVRDIADVRLAIDGAFEAAVVEATDAAARAPEPQRWQRVMLLAVTVIVAVLAWVLKPPPPPETPPLMRFAITPGTGLRIGNTTLDVAISPDGSRVVYRDGGQPFGLAVRAMDQLTDTRLEATVGTAPSSVFISPDSAWVGFLSVNDHTLKKVSILGGPAVTICDVGAPLLRGASWGRDDSIIFGTSVPSGLWRVSAGGGEPEELTTPESGSESENAVANHGWPEILPGGKALLFTIIPEDGSIETAQIAVLELETGAVRVLVPGGSFPRYSSTGSTGHIVYGFGGTLRAVAFDAERLAVTGNPFPVLEDVLTKRSGAANFGLARDGSLVYVTGTAVISRRLVWVIGKGAKSHSRRNRAGTGNWTCPRMVPELPSLWVT